MKNTLEQFQEGWDEELSKLSPEQQEIINSLKPSEMAGIIILHFVNPLNWARFFLSFSFDVIKELLKGK